MRLEDVFTTIENSRNDIIEDMSSMIRIPSIGPLNGGVGELERANFLHELIKDHFDVVERYDAEDSQYPGVIRPNIVARKHGKKKGTLWIVTHMDTVLPGDLSKWNTPPYEPTLKGDALYGLGTEDNGQSLIASYYGSKFIESGTLEGKSLALAFVSDEETMSFMGISHLIEQDLFSEDDFLLVPDWGTPNGCKVNIAEKHLIWLKFGVNGKQTHASMPENGINSFRTGIFMLTDLLDRLKERYSYYNEVFTPPTCTFEPTMASSAVGNVNTIPGYAEFHVDCRILPSYDMDDIIGFIRSVVKEHEERTGAVIDMEIVQFTNSGKVSDTDTVEYIEFVEAVKDITGNIPKHVGVGGGTCANYFRLKNLNAYVWQHGGGTLHQPNEHVMVSNIITEAKVYADLIFRLCVKG